MLWARLALQMEQSLIIVIRVDESFVWSTHTFRHSKNLLENIFVLNCSTIQCKHRFFLLNLVGYCKLLNSLKRIIIYIWPENVYISSHEMKCVCCWLLFSIFFLFRNINLYLMKLLGIFCTQHLILCIEIQEISIVLINIAIFKPEQSI